MRTMVKTVSVSICLATLVGCSDSDSMTDFERDELSDQPQSEPMITEPGLRLAAPEGETLTVPVRARRFESWEAVYAYAIDELGGHPVFDDDGEIIGVQGVSVVAGDVRFEDDETGVGFDGRELVPAMLAGSDGVLHVGDEAVPLGGSQAHEPGQTLTVESNPVFDMADYDCVGGDDCEACDGGDCISGHSWHTNYVVYKSVGSRTQQSSGGYVSVPYACCPTGQLVNHNGQQKCRIVTDWLPPEPPIFTKPIPIGYDYVNPNTCYSQATQNELTLRIRPHSSGPSLPINTTVTEFNTRQIELSEWYIGANVDFGSMSDVDGVCGMHFGSRGGTSLTRDGTASFDYCDTGFFP